MDYPWRSTEFPSGTQLLFPQYSGQGGRYQTTYQPNIPYAERDGMTLDLQLLLPVGLQDAPLVVFVQGSGWGPQDVYTAIGQLALLASEGFAVASVRYRDTGRAIFPAQVEDVKSAIRFLRANAGKYGFSSERIGIWGTSSGGHTAAMVGLTPGQYNAGDYADQSDAVMAVADFYGPSDLLRMCEQPGMDHSSPDSPESLLVGGALRSRPEIAAEASPVNHIGDHAPIPPFLLVHGDSDRKVHFGQSAILYEALRAAHAEVSLYAVKGADHSFLEPRSIRLVASFMHTYLRAE